MDPDSFLIRVCETGLKLEMRLYKSGDRQPCDLEGEVNQRSFRGSSQLLRRSSLPAQARSLDLMAGSQLMLMSQLIVSRLCLWEVF
jgi:hypothetical protein